MDDKSASRICILLKGNIDWEYLIRIAHRHGAAPLLYWSLNAACPEAVPRNFLSRLQVFFQANAQRNLFLTGELLKLLALLEAEGIAAIPLKGPVLAASVYGNLALRQFCDLDLLVHKQDVLRSKELLHSQGYRLWIQMTGAQEAAYLRSEHAYRFVRGDGRVIVELHWKIMPRRLAFPLDSERLWECLEPVSLGGVTMKNLPPEELLLILCMHGAKHYWSRLNWICDVAELVRVHHRLNWERVIEQAVALNSQRRLFLGLLLANEILGAPLPAAISHRLGKDPMVRQLTAEMRERLFCCEDGLPTENLKWHLFQCRLMERLQDRAQYIQYCLWTPNDKDWMFLPLPAPLFFLYSLLRPIRLIGKHGSGLLKFVFPSQSSDKPR
jgi:hypothetical protein